VTASTSITLRRVYDEPQADDGARILVDGLWPRGLSKHAAHLDAWFKDVAPSAELRRWYGHDPEKFEEFRRRYLVELKEPTRAAALAELRTQAERGLVSVLTATKNAAISHAAILVDLANG
jgi:uncharacterized protein YeaO (DUF488 family)